ncbi:UxaA family hydrolase [Herbaspirillum sp. RTI4]|uniref:UxaA family hydrolase n=1 Tax=Herbaspirillum sp. RTI4 TaxID=3048640 RepID=UPI002AB4E80A|nr:UxaA family hydrolase [Herbaspirillum sp. RTI4]MDY7578770.1 UxaA family hydrolase [Herbaspirillum sp. RTI4]MEA9982310.1 UxaA family hydrolase [Herbaspirillum sp. RTI4]
MNSQTILLAPEDNCVVATTNLEQGAHLELDGDVVVVSVSVTLGHKLTRRALWAGERVIKYGAVIGHVTEDVAKGVHLHTHNMVSDYIPTYTLDSGKSFVQHDH